MRVSVDLVQDGITTRLLGLLSLFCVYKNEVETWQKCWRMMFFPSLCKAFVSVRLKSSPRCSFSEFLLSVMPQCISPVLSCFLEIGEAYYFGIK